MTHSMRINNKKISRYEFMNDSNFDKAIKILTLWFDLYKALQFPKNGDFLNLV